MPGTFRLTIETGNAAFHDDETGEYAPGPQLARCLQLAADLIERDGISEGDSASLPDANGNTIGSFELAAERPDQVTIAAVLVSPRETEHADGSPWRHSSWNVTLTYQGRSAEFPWSQGEAHGTTPPTVADVLECLLSDACGYDNAGSFEEWAAEYGYDPDSRRAERLYSQVGQQASAVRDLLGDDFEAAISGSFDQMDADSWTALHTSSE